MDRKYEILLLLNPNLEKANVDKLISDVEAKIGGNVVKKEDWGVKELAYKIKKIKKAYFVLYYVETTSENIQSLKEMIAINSDIIRPMILRHEKKWPYEYKTAKELEFPAPRPRGNKPYAGKRGPRPQSNESKPSEAKETKETKDSSKEES